MNRRVWTWGVAALAAGALALGSVFAVGGARAQGAAVPLTTVSTEQGFGLFQQKCLGCHGNKLVAPAAPAPDTLRSMAPERIYEALTVGPMKSVGDTLTDPQRRQVSESIAGRLFGSTSQGDAKDMPNRCKANPAYRIAGTRWNGWGADTRNTRFQSAASAGLTASDLPKLKLKWAFGLPNSTSSYSQPTMVGGRVFIGTDTGNIYSIDAETGCVYWSFRAIAGVRAAPVIGPGKAGPVLYVGDLRAHFYALDARTGRQLWMNRVETNFTQRVTAGATLYNGVVYVPISAWEEFSAKVLDYGCCTARGAVAALDAATGKRLWKTVVIPGPLKATRKNSQGVQQYGPAGGAVWNTPAVDPKLGRIYFGTGDGTTYPAAPTIDSVMALDMKTGKVRWSYQAHAKDSFLVGCRPDQGPTDNCPTVQGPDWDIPASVILKDLPGGKRTILVGTKPGDILALDPDRGGKLIWRTNIRGGPPIGDGPQMHPGGIGVQWGGAADADTVYYGLRGGGAGAMKIATGERVWFNDLDARAGPGDPINHGAAATGIPGAAIFAGGDGRITALSTKDGSKLWSIETARTFDTVNKVPAHGGSLISSGVTVADGMMFIGSGYAVNGGAPGNVLLAYSIK